MDTYFVAEPGNENPQSLEIRQNIANIGVFVMKQTIAMQTNPEPSKLDSLIAINWSPPTRRTQHAIFAVGPSQATRNGFPYVSRRV